MEELPRWVIKPNPEHQHMLELLENAATLAEDARNETVQTRKLVVELQREVAAYRRMVELEHTEYVSLLLEGANLYNLVSPEGAFKEWCVRVVRILEERGELVRWLTATA
jgi:type II secretory pathway component PulF